MPVDDTESTLADIATLMGKPPRMRTGYTMPVRYPNPAAGAGLTHVTDPAWWERTVAITATLTCSATAATRTLVVQYCDQDGNVFAQEPISAALGASQVQTVYADLTTTPAAVAGSSEANAGTVTDPAAGADISGTVSLAPGTWSITATGFVSGTVTAADANNMAIDVGGSYAGAIVYPGVANVPGSATVVTTVAATTTAFVASPGAASGAAAVYNGGLTATPISAAGAYATLPDLVMKSAWKTNLTIIGVQAADQLSAITYLTERYPSNWADGTLREDREAWLRALVRDEIGSWQA